MAKKSPEEGRPTKYKEEYNDLVYKYALLGATDEDLAKFLAVCIATINNWKKKEPQFLESIKKGKEDADAQVVKSLFKRATGITVKEVRSDANGGSETVKELPPDTTAAIFWLKNRQRQNWKDKQDIDQVSTVTVNDERDLQSYSIEDLQALNAIHGKYTKKEEQ